MIGGMFPYKGTKAASNSEPEKRLSIPEPEYNERPWVKDADDMLDDYFLSGYTTYEIMKEMNRTFSDVISRIIKHVIEGRIKWSEFGKRCQGEVPENFIDEKFSRYYEEDIMILSVPPFSRKFDPLDEQCKEDIISLKKEGYTIANISIIYSTDYETMRKFCRKIKIA